MGMSGGGSDELLASQFVAITGSDQSTALFFLEVPTTLSAAVGASASSAAVHPSLTPFTLRCFPSLLCGWRRLCCLCGLCCVAELRLRCVVCCVYLLCSGGGCGRGGARGSGAAVLVRSHRSCGYRPRSLPLRLLRIDGRAEGAEQAKGGWAGGGWGSGSGRLR